MLSLFELMLTLLSRIVSPVENPYVFVFDCCLVMYVVWSLVFGLLSIVPAHGECLCVSFWIAIPFHCCVVVL